MKARIWTFLLCALAWTPLSPGQLRIVQYNAGAVKPGTETVLEQIGNEIVNGIARPIDVLVLQEQQSPTSVAGFVNLLNGIHGPGTYVAAPFVGASSGGGLPAMVYRPNALTLVEYPVGIGTLSSTSNARQTIKYRLRPVGYGADADLYLYASHLKASNSSTDVARRNAEAITNRADADAMGPGRNIIYLGDFNLYRGTEAAFTTLTAPGNGQAVDPLHAPLIWSGNRVLFTQSPVTVAEYSGQVVGGMNDRFDFQLSSAEMNDGRGLAYIPGSYRAFGNNGTQPLSGAVNDPANTWDNPGLTVPRLTLLNALAAASDHIPVVADYQLPARMEVNLGNVPSRVIAGASVPVNMTVRNSAPAGAAIGADRLYYNVSGSGAIGGGASGTATATLVGNTHGLSLATGAPGVASGTIAVSSSSQAVASGTYSQAVSTTVLAHAKPSFSSGSLTTALDVDFGIRARGSPAPQIPFAIRNLADISGYTAGLDLDAVVGTGHTAKLTTNVSPFKAQPAGSQVFAAFLDTSASGEFSGSYSFFTSDEDIPGAANLAPLTLNLHAIVAPGGDTNLDGMVDLVDLRKLVTNWQGSGTWHDGDFNADGRINSTDLGMLAANWQALELPVDPVALGLPAGELPEPGGALGTIIAAWVAGLRRIRARV